MGTSLRLVFVVLAGAFACGGCGPGRIGGGGDARQEPGGAPPSDDRYVPAGTPAFVAGFGAPVRMTPRARTPGPAGDTTKPEPELGPSHNTGSPLGQNLALSSYYSASWPFVDVMHMADPFYSGTREVWSDGRPLDRDAHGWVRSLQPGQIARTVPITAISPSGTFAAPAGEYVVLYDGRGTLEYGGITRIVSQAPGRDVLEIAADGMLILELTQTDPNDPLRNLRVILPGGRCSNDTHLSCGDDGQCGDGTCLSFESTYREHIFHPDFLREQRPFKILRFMDWMQTNRLVVLEDGILEDFPIREWAEYPERSDAFWRPTPFSVIAQLANELHVDPWINIPHAASDDFVRQAARVIRDELHPDLRVYVEYSNEVWNGSFDQNLYTSARGCERYSADPVAECRRPQDAEICMVGPWDPWADACLRYGQRYFAQRTAEVMALFEEEMGGRERLVRVLGAQVGAMEWRTLAQLELAWNGTERVADRVDAVAVAPYFGGGATFNHPDDAFVTNPVAVRGWPAGTYELLTGALDDPYGGVIDWIRTDWDLLRSRPDLDHLRYIAYEGGQHLYSHDSDDMAMYMSLNADPRMKSILLQLLDTWSEITGGEMFVHFESACSGIWGSKSYQGQPRSEAPKYDALMTFIERAQRRGD